MTDPISVGSVSVDVVPDATGFPEELKAKLRDLSIGIRVKIDDALLKAQVDEATRTREATVGINLDDKVAAARLDALTRPREVHVRANTSGLDGLISKLDGLPGGFGLLGTAAVGLGPALIPVTAAAAGLAGILAAPLAAAGGGLTVGALIAGKAVADTEKQKKQIDELAKKVAAAKQNLANVEASSSTSSANAAAAAQRAHATAVANISASPGSAASAQRRLAAADAALANRLASGQASNSARVEAAQRKVNEATAAYDKALKGLNPSQVKFLDAQHKLSTSFHDLETKSGPVLFKPITTGLDLLATILPHVEPLLTSVSGGLDTLLTEADHAAQGGGLDKVVKSLSAMAGPDIVLIGNTLGNIAQGFVGIGTAFAPLSGSLLSEIHGWSVEFANIGSSQGLHDFVGYVHREGPLVASTLGSVGGAIVHIATALAPLGHTALQIIGGFANEIDKIPTPALTVAAGAFASIALSLKGISLAKGALGALSKLGLGGGGLGGTLGGEIASLAKPIPVFVTNNIPGGGGGLLGNIEAAAGGAAAAAGKVLPTAEEAAAAALESVPKLFSLKGLGIAGFSLGDAGNEVRNSGIDPNHLTRTQAQQLLKSGSLDAGMRKDLLAQLHALNISDAQSALSLQKLLHIAVPAAPSTGPRPPLAAQQPWIAALPKFSTHDSLGGLLTAPTGRGTAGRPSLIESMLSGHPGSRAVAPIAAGILLDTKKFDTNAARVKATSAELGRLVILPKVDLNTSLLDTKLAAERSKLASLSGGLLAPVLGQWGGVPVAGHRANGGMVRMGQTYQVGERGSEMFTAPADGYITPHGRRAPGGLTGPLINIEKVVAQDANHLLRQLQDRTRLAGLDGIARVGS